MTDEILITTITTIGSIIIALIGTLTIIYKNLRNHIDKRSREQIRATDVSFQKLNGMLMTVMHSFGRPCWLKMANTDKNGNLEFRMIELNQEYTDSFGITRDSYINRTDLEAGHNREEAERFYKHDIEVFASGKSETFTETVQGKELTFRKIKVVSPDGAAKGVFGYQEFN